ncbi:hypothetical protein VF13_41620 [Nostoc linckia z16]|nr:hypothetical protein VF13_41620 [Nostoc linckia z16]
MKKEQQTNQNQVKRKVKIRVFIFAFMTFALMAGCTTQNDIYTLYILFDNVEGLKDDSEVRSRGLDVGSIESMKLYKDKVIVEVKMMKDIKVPIDSKIVLDSEGIVGSKYIDITIGQATSFHLNKDTIIANVSDNINIINDLPEQLIKLTDSLRSNDAKK